MARQATWQPLPKQPALDVFAWSVVRDQPDAPRDVSALQTLSASLTDRYSVGCMVAAIVFAAVSVTLAFGAVEFRGRMVAMALTGLFAALLLFTPFARARQAALTLRHGALQRMLINDDRVTPRWWGAQHQLAFHQGRADPRTLMLSTTEPLAGNIVGVREHRDSHVWWVAVDPNAEEQPDG